MIQQEYFDMDTQEKIRYISESSNASTSGYSTMSSGLGTNLGNISPVSSAFSTPPSPAASPGSMLKTDFSNLRCNSPQQQHSPHYTPLQNTSTYGVHNYMNVTSGSTMMSSLPQHHFGMQPMFAQTNSSNPIKKEYVAELRINEYPVEKFRFRYKSEMHGTHGSLNGTNCKRSSKTYPEVQLYNYNGHAVIRCSLFQTNLDSPHSHQLVVRKDDADICDPHDVSVSPEQGYIVQFQQMGIIHTAKKYIREELLKKKMARLKFELGRDELSTKQTQELYKETEKEAKDMNLNQVRLCFEAFKIEDSGLWTRIAAPVYTNPINNRKSAQTGELKICRLSIVAGSVNGGDDLILLVEKVSKKNIKVRFYELNEDDEVVWEALAKFRESDVHHQYAIVCQTPPYKDKDIDKPVEVFIELVRPTDDERSFPSVLFRYKPRDTVASRKRRRTCSTATNSSGSASSLSSFELPKTILETSLATGAQAPIHGNAHPHNGFPMHAPTISEEYDKDQELNKLMNSEMFRTVINSNSEELSKLFPPNISESFNLDEFLAPQSHEGHLEKDGCSSTSSNQHTKKLLVLKTVSEIMATSKQPHLQRIFQIYEESSQPSKKLTEMELANAAGKVAEIFIEHAEKNDNGDTIIHEIITNDDSKLGIKACHILNFFKLNDLLSRALNTHGESGLHCACVNDRPHFIRPLLGLGCNANIQDQYGNTALHVALKEEHFKCVESFFNAGNLQLNLTIKNDEGFTPLHLAIRLNNSDIAAKLLKYDKSAALCPNTKDGNNALHMAILQNNLQVIKLILENNSNPGILSMRNSAGLTPLDLAKSLDPKMGSKILTFLSSYCTATETNVVIKEEDVSSSSTEEDDENEFVKIKEELSDDDSNKIKPNSKKCSKSLEDILNNVVTFNELVKVLDDSNKWKLLAKELDLSHLMCLWSNASDMLNYLKKQASSIPFEKFAASLAIANAVNLQKFQ